MYGGFRWYSQGFNIDGIDPDTRRLDPEGVVALLVSLDKAVGMVFHSTNQVVKAGLVQNCSPCNRFIVGAAIPADASQIKLMLPITYAPGTQFDLEVD